MGAIPAAHTECTVVIGTYGAPAKVHFVGIIEGKVVISWPNQCTMGYEPQDVTFI